MGNVLTMRKKTRSKQGLLDLCSRLPEEAQVVEIGSYAGESAEVFISSLKIRKLYCIDPWEGGYDLKDKASSSDMGQAEKYFDIIAEKYFRQILKLKLSSSQAVNFFSNEMLDMVYLDGNHSFEAVYNDIGIWLPKVKTNGILAGHDVKWRGVKKALVRRNLVIEEVFVDSSWISIKREST